eukprot:scaffold219862_cov45-Prasinocladus_malaysianus.AAC.1
MSQADRAKTVPKEKKKVVILYASQTGTCQEIAKGIAAEAVAAGLPAKARTQLTLSCPAYGFNEFGFENLNVEKAPIVVMVAASTGDGDPPDNSAKCLVQLKYGNLLHARKSNAPDLLKGIKFTCLGLGDSNYTKFCAVPKAFTRRFQELGADCFHPVIHIDEVDGIEEPVEKWCEELKPKLEAACKDELGGDKENTPDNIAPAPVATGTELVGVPAMLPCGISLVWESDATKSADIASAENSGPSAEALNYRDEKGLYSRATPFWATVSKCENLCNPTSDREVLHMELDLTGSGMVCHPGDSIGVSPLNSLELVDGILEQIGADGSKVFSVTNVDGSPAPGMLGHLRWPCTLRHALAAGCDITGVPKKSVLRMLAEYCSNQAEKQELLYLCSRGGKEAYKADIVAGQPSLLDLLKRFPSCKPPLDHLLEALPPLAERLYSLTSSQLTHPNAAHVAFSVVNFSTDRYGHHAGVATNWLKSICLDSSGACTKPRIAVFLRPNESFRPPQDLTAPLIMIGPGTGVAPFRGFLQERQAKLQDGADLGQAWLFAGCRRRDEDYLYQSELEGFARSGVLTHLIPAFSREQAEKVYVQHKMREYGAELCKLIMEPNSFVMVCGDGSHMAKD